MNRFPGESSMSSRHCTSCMCGRRLSSTQPSRGDRNSRAWVETKASAFGSPQRAEMPAIERGIGPRCCNSVWAPVYEALSWFAAPVGFSEVLLQSGGCANATDREEVANQTPDSRDHANTSREIQTWPDEPAAKPGRHSQRASRKYKPERREASSTLADTPTAQNQRYAQ